MLEFFDDFCFCFHLSDVLMSLPVSEAPLQLLLQILFEAWWKKGLKEREKFGRSAFLISLQKSFILKKPVSIFIVLLLLDPERFNMFVPKVGCFPGWRKVMVTDS